VIAAAKEPGQSRALSLPSNGHVITANEMNEDFKSGPYFNIDLEQEAECSEQKQEQVDGYVLPVPLF
jgi:hypothetical protein